MHRVLVDSVPFVQESPARQELNGHRGYLGSMIDWFD